MSLKAITTLRQLFNCCMKYYQPTCCFNQIRTTYILKRKHEPMLSKVGLKPRKLRRRNNVYDLVEFTESKPHGKLDVILLDYVEGIGLKGEEVCLNKHIARNNLILPKLAVYATDENRKKFKIEMDATGIQEHSSKTAEKTIKFLSKSVVLINMNLEEDWTIEPWHVKVSFRKGIIIPDYAITLPPRPISGPNVELDGKCFCVTVTINNLEKTIVRCRIHHWHANQGKRLPPITGYWVAPLEPIFAEDYETLKSLPSPPAPK